MAFYDEVHSVRKYRVGSRKRDAANNEYIYLKGVASTAVGSWVNFDTAADGTTALVDTAVAGTQVGRLAVAKAAVVADKWGWYQVYGNGSALALTGSTDTKNLFATSTAGSLDDSGAGAEVLVFGVFTTGAVNETTFLQAVVLNYPFMTGLTLD